MSLKHIRECIYLYVVYVVIMYMVPKNSRLMMSGHKTNCT